MNWSMLRPRLCRQQRDLNCEGGVDVISVVTLLVRGVAQVLHGDQVVELSVQLEVQEREGKEEDKEGQVEVEEERSRTQRRNAHEH